jgi:hypothetical protein
MLTAGGRIASSEGRHGLGRGAIALAPPQSSGRLPLPPFAGATWHLTPAVVSSVIQHPSPLANCPSSAGLPMAAATFE